MGIYQGNVKLSGGGSGTDVDVSGPISEHNTSPEAHADIREAVSAAESNAKAYADEKIAGIDIAGGSGGGVNPNLLDNWYFGNPVDQRGGYVVPKGTAYFVAGSNTITGYLSVDTKADYVNANGYPHVTINGVDYACTKNSAVRGYTGAIYGIDRWVGTSACTATVADGSVKLSFSTNTQQQQYIQYVNNTQSLLGKTVTLSVIVDNVLKSVTIAVPETVSTGTIGSGVSVSQGIAAYLRCANGVLYVSIYATTGYSADTVVELYAVKLELGDTQTLAHQDASGKWVLNETPSYHVELLKCIQSKADSTDTYANKAIYHTGNKPTAADVGAASAEHHQIKYFSAPAQLGLDPATFTLDSIRDKLLVHSVFDFAYWISSYPALSAELPFSANGYVRLTMFRGPQAGYTTVTAWDIKANQMWTKTYTGTWSKWALVHSEASKPTGSYTGNSDSTTRTINVGGTGDLLYVYNDKGYSPALVTPAGVMVWSSTEVKFEEDYATFANGVLTLATTGNYVNKSNVTYTYRVL